MTPILRVEDVSRSVDYYVHKLGFKISFETPGFVSVTSRSLLPLPKRRGPRPSRLMGFWVGVEDVAALFEQYRLNGVKVRNPPTNYAWTGEMQAEDLDGNILPLGSEPKSDQTVGVARHAREPLGAVAGGRVDSSF